MSRNLGLRYGDAPEIIADGSNVLVHLVPAPVVDRVAASTALVRQPAERWLALDLDLAGYLTARSFPVVPPSRELPPGPHHHDGLALAFWEFVKHDRTYAAGAHEADLFQCEIHAALRGYRASLQRLSPFAEIPRWLDEVESWNTADSADIAILLRRFTAVAAEIDKLYLAERPFHRDAHKKNILKTSKGLAWTDSGDACFVPIEWDLACFIRTSREPSEVALASYGADSDPNRLKPFFAACDCKGPHGAHSFHAIPGQQGASRRVDGCFALALWRPIIEKLEPA